MNLSQIFKVMDSLKCFQVGQEKKWGEVVSALKLEGSNAKLSAQVEKLYAHLLYQFEKLYFYRCSAQQAATGG